MLSWKMFWRDWRGGELGILALALVAAVAIVTAIALFADRLQHGIVSQSRDFLAADRVLRSARPVPDQWLAMGAETGLRQAQVVQFQSMVYAGEAMRLASVKAVDDHYPLRGRLQISDESYATSREVARGPAPGEVWLDARLFTLLDVRIGDLLSVGEANLKVSAAVVGEPDRASNFYLLGPRVLMNSRDIAATGVVQPGSRVEFRYLFAGPEPQLERYHQWLAPQLEPQHRWLDLSDAQPRIAKALDRAERFLLLAGALGVGLAGVAIALAARRYSERHYDPVAILKSLGASNGKVMSLYTANLLILATVAAALGCLLGWMIQQLFVELFRGYLGPDGLPPLSWQPFAIGVITALVCLLAFALPPLLNLRGVSPLRVLRRDVPVATLSGLATVLIGALAVIALMFWYSQDLTLTLAIAGGVAAVLLLLGGLTLLLLRRGLAQGMQAGSAYRLAVASLRRRGAMNAAQVVIFALAIMLLLVMLLVRTALLDEWQMQLPAGTPNHFLLNVAPDQVPDVVDLLASAHLRSEPLFPMVRGRLTHINGEPVQTRVSKEEADNAGIDRELNLTWSEQLPSDNELTAGQWWPANPDPQVSIEQRLAERLGISVGSQLQFQIGSESFTVPVTSIRALDWDTMKPNFYMVFPKAVLQPFAASYITSFYLPAAQKEFLNQLLREFPTITVIAMDGVIHQIQEIVSQITRAIEVVLILIIACALLVLVASVNASVDSRLHEGALLRALGGRRSLVLNALVLEFGGLGALAGVFAVVGAELSVWQIQARVLDMSYSPHPMIWWLGPLLATALIAAAGFLSCRKVVRVSPVEVLRQL